MDDAPEVHGMPKDTSRSPNLILITPDQMRGDCMGCTGHPLIHTPNLDALAAGGALFPQAYAQNPVCVPSRSSIISGQYPHAHGVRDNGFVLSEEIPTLPGILREAGYRTVSVGKMHFHPIDASYGFESRRIGEDKSASYDDHYRRYLEARNLRHLSPDVMWRDRNADALMGMTSPLSEEDYIDSWCGREAADQIRMEDDRPLFMWVGFPSPHVPTDPPQPWAGMYKSEDVPMPLVNPEEWKSKPPEMSRGIFLETDQIRRFRVHYYAMISLIDKWVGEIVGALEDTDQYENTLILFTSDHGDFAGEHGKGFKSFCLYEDLLRVPMILHWPAGIREPMTSDALVELVDILPTFLECAGIGVPWGVQGRSLKPLLQNKSHSVRAFAFSEYFYQKMIRTPEWKLIYYAGKPYGELFNLAQDAGEFENLYDDHRHKDIRHELEKELLDYLVASERPLPEAGEYWKNVIRKIPVYEWLEKPWRGSV